MDNYEKQANDFAKKQGIKLTVIDEDFRKYFPGDKQCRSVFKLRLQRRGKSYTFNFGQSIINSGIEPTMYDVLSCITKNDVGSFEDFCYEFGYNVDSTAAENTYKNVCKEYEAVCRLFGDIIDELQEIY